MNCTLALPALPPVRSAAVRMGYPGEVKRVWGEAEHSFVAVESVFSEGWGNVGEVRME